MKLGTRIMLAAAGAVALSTLCGIAVVFRLSKDARVAELHGKMTSIISQSEFVAESMDEMHRHHMFDMAAITREAKAQAAGRPLSEVYRSTDLYKTIPIVAAWKSVLGAAERDHFTFRTPSRPGVRARNPDNESGEQFAAAFAAFAKGDKEYFLEDRSRDLLLLARPVRLQESCLTCHGDPAGSLTGDGRDPLGFPMENLKAGDLKGAFVLTAGIGHDPVVMATMSRMAVAGAAALAIVLIGFHYFNQRSIIRPLAVTIQRLEEATSNMACAAAEISNGSQAIADGAGDQAASLEQTSASLEEMASMTSQNAASAGQLNDLSAQTRKAADHGAKDMEQMSSAAVAIKDSNADIAKIIRTIDEIAFQTNMLALNAAVEAARAGEMGTGFAVVADEVRGLAKRSAQAARETSDRIESAIERTNTGVQISAKVAATLKEILSDAQKADELAQHVARASQEQNQGLKQVNAAVAQIDRVTQSNAAAAEQSAAAATSLEAQASAMRATMGQLLELVGTTDHVHEDPTHRVSTSIPIPIPDRSAPAPEPPTRPASSQRAPDPLNGDTTPAGANLLRWNEAAMATGVQSVDAQHKQLIDMLRQLDEACKHGAARERLNEMVIFLGDYATRHFTEEESIMDEMECPTRAKNKLAHRQFLHQFAKFRERFDKEGATTSLVLELKTLTSAWLKNHICRVDTGLRQCAGTCARSTASF